MKIIMGFVDNFCDRSSLEEEAASLAADIIKGKPIMLVIVDLSANTVG